MVSYEALNLAINFGIFVLTLVGVVSAITTRNKTKKK